MRGPVLVLVAGIGILAWLLHGQQAAPVAAPRPGSDVGALPASAPIPPGVEILREVAPSMHRVSVVDVGGVPLAGCRCRVIRSGARWVADQDVVEIGVTSDDGTLAYEWSRSGDFTLLVDKQGYARAEAPMESADVVVLQATAGIEFHCRSETGDVIPGATIAVSRRPIPALDTLPSDAQSGSSPEAAIHIAYTDAKGNALVPVALGGRYWFAARHPSYFGYVDGGANMVDCSERRKVTVVLGELWVAGVQFEGPGEVACARYSFSGAATPGSSSQSGRDAMAVLSSKWPNAIHTSTTFTDSRADHKAVFSAYHTILGWVVQEVPYQKLSGFVPMILAVDEGPPRPLGSIRLRWEGPAGEEIPVPGASLRNGGLDWPALPAEQIEHVEERLRRYAGVTRPLGADPVKVPPGRYQLVITDSCIQHSLVARPKPIDIVAGDERTITIKLKWRLAPLRLTIDAAPDLVWERANVSILVDGEVLNSQVFHRAAGWNGLQEPRVPVGIPIELQVKSPDCLPASVAAVVDGPETPVVIPLRPK
jgi:hypothetical protein